MGAEMKKYALMGVIDMLVKATDKYEKLNLQDNELGRIPKPGEQFEISEERYEVLTKTNRFNEVFVEKVEETKTEKAIKKTTKKAQ